MGYWVGNIFAVRFFKNREHVIFAVKKVAANLGFEIDAEACVSEPLHGNKGDYIVIAGIFNYWSYDRSSEFAMEISAELSSIVIHTCVDEEAQVVNVALWNEGKSYYGGNSGVDNPIRAKYLRDNSVEAENVRLHEIISSHVNTINELTNRINELKLIIKSKNLLTP